MNRIVWLFLFILLSVGCQEMESPLESPPIEETVACPEPEVVPMTQNPIVALPTDTAWMRIATLQRNPLRPAEFYLSDAEKERIYTAYLEGRHFIFEFGSETIERNINKIRHYILQPEPPFQDKNKSDWTLLVEEREGVKWHVHRYTFLSEGWYEPIGFVFGHGGEAIGFGVAFNETVFEPRGAFIGEGTVTTIEIGLISELSNPVIGRGRSFIDEDTRLRVYVSR